MKSLLIAAVTAVVVLSGCSVYREGQTPDDVYFSPAKEKGAAYVAGNSDREDGRRYNNDSYNGYDDYATADDRWLMMRVRNRSRWSIFDDYNYYNPYDNMGGGFGMGYGYAPGISMGYGGFGYNPFSYSYYNHFNNYYNWNSYYNPYYPQIIVVNPKTNPAGYSRIRNFNLNNYNNRNYDNRRPLSTNPHVNRPANQGYNNSNNSTLGNSFRRVFSNSNSNTPRNNNRDTYRAPSQDRPVRVYSPSSNNNSTYSPSRSSGSSGSSSGSSGSSSGGGSRPSRR